LKGGCLKLNATNRTEQHVNTSVDPKPVDSKLVASAHDYPHKAPLGLRTVALFELGKGVLVLVGGFYLLSLVGKDVEHEATNLLHLLHADPAWHVSRWFVDTAGRLTDQRLRQFALIAVIYCIVRIVEAFGLWHELHWAEWFAAISAGLFLPVELFHIFIRATIWNVGFFVANVLIVAYLWHILASNHRRAMELKNHQPQPAPVKS
jgi:uncharacterized membrane protein (DUF2068 family)